MLGVDLDFVPTDHVYVASPPDISRAMLGMEPGRLLEVLQTVAVHGQRTDYIHWDKLRQLRPPDGITAEEWWMAIRMSRGGQLTRLPLRDVTGTAFGYQTPPEALRGLHYIDQHCSGEIAMDEVVTSDRQARHHYLVSSLMEEAIRSSQLEGATTSRRIAKELLRTGRPPRDRSETMILNNYRALEFMRDEMGEQLTPELVVTLQRILTQGTLDDPTGAGRIQTPDEERVVVLDATDGTVIHTPPAAAELPERLRAMCDFANETADADGVFIHPVVRAIMLHFWLAYDHPFQDGNGRTSRALFYWYLRTRKYWLVEYLSISRVLRKAPGRYSRAFLLTETDGGDATYFLLHQLDVIERAVVELQTYLKRKVREVKDVEQLIKGAEAFNHRQLALLGDAVRHPDHSYSYQSHATSHRVTHETARTDLLGLLEHGLLERRRLNRKHVYSPVSDLPEVLKTL